MLRDGPPTRRCKAEREQSAERCGWSGPACLEGKTFRVCQRTTKLTNVQDPGPSEILSTLRSRLRLDSEACCSNPGPTRDRAGAHLTEKRRGEGTKRKKKKGKNVGRMVV